MDDIRLHVIQCKLKLMLVSFGHIWQNTRYKFLFFCAVVKKKIRIRARAYYNGIMEVHKLIYERAHQIRDDRYAIGYM